MSNPRSFAEAVISPALGETSSLAPVERPAHLPVQGPLFGSDAVADTLRALDIPYIALNPGASFRGLHDSLVNHLGNERPTMLLCLHEEHAIAIAQGYAKVTGRLMAAAVHSNVGLMHGAMAIFNAWCDRMPVLVIGATGPVDAAKRRPWIDWIHTARDQGALVRSYVKWDDQPASPGAAREALLRAFWLSQTAPMGPTYVNLDAEMQEAPLDEPLPALEASRYAPPAPSAAHPDLVRRAAEILSGARRPLILMGRVSRDLGAWKTRLAFAERLGARVVTDIKVGAAFPTDHPLHVGAPATFASAAALEAIREADAILSLDWVDLAGTLKSAFGWARCAATIVQVSVDHHVHNGWSMDHQGLPPVDVFLAAEPDLVVPALSAALGAGLVPKRAETAADESPTPELDAGPVAVEQLAHALRRAVGDRDVSLLQLPLSWNGASWPFRHPLDYLGSDGGGGIGSGPGLSVGAALALKDSGRLPVAIIGDGNFLMGVTAVWTAAHYRIPVLIVVANNQSFFNDEVHQERVARTRGRPVENKWIGQRIADPGIDLAAIARAQGAVAFGPVESADALVDTFRQAIEAVEGGAVVVVDVRVQPGYTPAMTAALTRSE